MKVRKLLALPAALVFSCLPAVGEVEAVSFEKVSLSDSFWSQWREKQASSTIPAALKNTQNAADNLEIAGLMRRGLPHKRPQNLVRFISSDLYKIMESASCSLMVLPNPALEARIDKIAGLIEAAQLDDGYLFVPHICGLKIGGIGKAPYSMVAVSHELYNVGHLYETAIAYCRATGKDTLLRVSEKSARHIEKVIFKGDPKYNGGKPILEAPGHQEIELALCRLAKETGKPEYLETAIKLLELRGRNEYARKLLAEGGGGFDKLSYSQQHMPVSEQREPAGHAVRAMYQYTAMALADAMSGRSGYAAALDSIWGNIVSTRMSITGGLGAVNSIEGFGREYFLPNKTAYNETCAAVASVFFGHAMFMRTLDAKYLDILEITLFNGALSGIGLEGDTFFYENPLEADGVSAFNHGSNARVKWMSCACCPPNISRLIMRMTGFFYARDAENLWVNMYASSSAKFDMGASKIGVEQKSDYPFGGDTSIGLSLAKPMKFALRLRIPTWASGENFTPGGLYRYAFPAARKPAIKINGEAAEFKTEKGFAVLERVWKDGDTVELSLPMRPMAVLCDGRVEDNAGRAAIVRGPLVYCAEQFDNGAVGKIYLSNLRETQNGAKADVFTGGKLKGIGFVKIPCKKLGEDGGTEALLVPYFAWNNRGAGSMSVWLPISKSLAQNGAASRRGALGSLVESVSASDGSQLAGSILDGETPASSAKIDVPSWKTCEFDKDGFAYADIKFKRPVEIDTIGAYFGTLNGLGIPKTWKISYSLGAEPLRDMEVYQTDSYNTERDKFNVVHPAKPFKCDRLRVWLKVDNYRVMLCELDISAK